MADHRVRSTAKPRRLTRAASGARAGGVALTIVLATLAAVWGYLSFFTDTLVLRQTPLMTSESPDGRWELRVYEEAPGTKGIEDDAAWLATLRPLGRPESRERVFFRGNTASFKWRGEDQLIVHETFATRERVVDAASAGELSEFDNDERGFIVIFAWAAFTPALVILAVGIAASIFVPRVLQRRRGGAERTSSV
jgi:hypothetical protein